MLCGAGGDHADKHDRRLSKGRARGAGRDSSADTAGVIDRKLDAIIRHGSKAVAAVLLQIARDVMGGKTIAVQFRPTSVGPEGKQAGPVVLHHGRHSVQRWTMLAALLLLDADAITAVNRILYGREDLRSLAIYGKRLVHVTQCTG
jgi:hypothetical protein